MRIAIIHRADEAMDVLYTVKELKAVVKDMTMLQGGDTYKTLVTTDKKSAVEGLEYVDVDNKRTYVLYMSRQ